MGGGNGAKAAARRDRQAKDNKKPAGSQLKSIEATKTIVCVKCSRALLVPCGNLLLRLMLRYCTPSLAFDFSLMVYRINIR